MAGRASIDPARVGGRLARVARRHRMARIAPARQRRIPGTRSVGTAARGVREPRCGGATTRPCAGTRRVAFARCGNAVSARRRLSTDPDPRRTGRNGTRLRRALGRRAHGRSMAGGAQAQPAAAARVAAPTQRPASHCAPGAGRAPGGVRFIAAQSDCPFQAVARFRLRAEPWPAPYAGLSAREHGMLAHAAMATFWSVAGDQASLVALSEEALTERIATAVDHVLPLLPAPRWRTLPWLLREGEARRLAALLRAWLAVERVRPPFTVQAIE